MKLIINGEEIRFETALNVAEMLDHIGYSSDKVAIERNREIVPKSSYDVAQLNDGDQLEIVRIIGGGDHTKTDDEDLVIAGRRFKSRLITGTGKYETYKLNAEAVEASECDMITVAVRRVNLTQADEPLLMDYLDPAKYTFLPNTAGCFTAEDALRTLRLAREIGGWDLVKLEILGDKKTLYPRMPETLETLKVLKKEGFDVMVYCSDDPNFCKALEEEGASAVMPIAAPIGSGLGILNPVNLRIIKENANVPVIVDAGIGTASDAAQAMELGCDAVIMNTAIAEAKDPVRMANAMKHAVIAGRDAYLAGRMPKKQYADPSSPLAGLI
ncbi:sulfur carrier protein ThiS [Terasakiella sp. A23]|uniref:sulfur carrier protein ThiS n=1 Tax=Terasakiella sp. FCG-A23 TaxID=3080561 RepID=UPI0029536684|nr:sulfur carrier protein ThiS [Terasakiella sp. A23]MDV7341297.1 sulfur carrier protein ThiS [Terasakiella sp. A23]